MHTRHITGNYLWGGGGATAIRNEIQSDNYLRVYSFFDIGLKHTLCTRNLHTDAVVGQQISNMYSYHIARKFRDHVCQQKLNYELLKITYLQKLNPSKTSH